MSRPSLTPNAVTKTITLPRQVCEDIAKLAEQNRRTFSNQVFLLIEIAIESLKRGKVRIEEPNL